jgi:hypothetical protein
MLRLAAMHCVDVDDQAIREIERLREANEAFGKRQKWWNEKMIALEAERDAAVGLLRELVESRHKHYIHQTDEIMPRWDERVAAAIDAAKGE